MGRVLGAWFLAFFATICAANTPDADKVLQEAEFIRNPQVDYEVSVGLMDVKKGKKEIRTYQTQVKGRDKALVRFLTPVSDQGTKVLMVVDEMWVYLPSAAKPVRVSPRQKLTGNAAYGDVARLNFTGNYKASFKRTDKMKGSSAHVLDLVAIEGKPVTYDRIEYWVDAKTSKPLKALYGTASGKVLREGYFEKFANVLGVNRPTVFRLVDHMEPQHETYLLFKNTKKVSLPDIAFERQNLSRD
jgi:hypothetical protein